MCSYVYRHRHNGRRLAALLRRNGILTAPCSRHSNGQCLNVRKIINGGDLKAKGGEKGFGRRVLHTRGKKKNRNNYDRLGRDDNRRGSKEHPARGRAARIYGVTYV